MTRHWIAERKIRATTTFLVQASSRKEAQEKLNAGQFEAVDTEYHHAGKVYLVREDKVRLKNT